MFNSYRIALIAITGAYMALALTGSHAHAQEAAKPFDYQAWVTGIKYNIGDREQGIANLTKWRASSCRVISGTKVDTVNSALMTHTGPRLMANGATQKVHLPLMLALSAKAGFAQRDLWNVRNGFGVCGIVLPCQPSGRARATAVAPSELPPPPEFWTTIVPSRDFILSDHWRPIMS
jgi:hypothetical protein